MLPKEVVHHVFYGNQYLGKYLEGEASTEDIPIEAYVASIGFGFHKDRYYWAVYEGTWMRPIEKEDLPKEIQALALLLGIY